MSNESTIPVVTFYAAVLTIFYVALSFRTLSLRRKFGVGVGDGGEQELMRAARVHGNFAEYVPLALLMMYLTEVQGTFTTWIHVLGVGLIVGRVSHAYGVSQVKEDYRFRVFGMVCTLSVLIGSSIRLLVAFFTS